MSGTGIEIYLKRETVAFSRASETLKISLTKASLPNTHINTHSRDRLKKLIEYIARGPLSNKRLKIVKGEKVKLQLKYTVE